MIKLEQIKHYLGTGLAFQLQNDMHDEFYELEDCDGFKKAFSKGSIWKMVGHIEIDIPAKEGKLIGTIVQHKSGIYTDTQIGVKPLMYRLCDLDKFIPELGFVPVEELTTYAQDRLGAMDYDDDLRDWPFQDLTKLFKWNFWVFDQSLFDQKIIIDKLKQ
jgi:hypothetical protein